MKLHIDQVQILIVHSSIFGDQTKNALPIAQWALTNQSTCQRQYSFTPQDSG
jgi:hypothetical protein